MLDAPFGIHVRPAMIVSASYKTDIPAFYGRWFMNRLEAGFCRMVNPYGRQVHTIPLTREAVDGFVFWTRNAGPFLGALAEVRRRGFPFVVQFTLTGYPRALEPAVADRRRAAAQIHALARDFGREAVVWRYDPILVTSLTPRGWHTENFARIAGELAGAVGEVVISFAHLYAKTQRNLSAAGRVFGVSFEDPDAAWKRETAAILAGTAARFGMRLSLCAQPEFLGGAAGEARCIDAERLARLAGRPIAARLKGNRPGCGCFECRDIGEYDTCPHGCVYCYAVSGRDLARRRFAAHDPDSEFLFAPASATLAAG